VWSGYRNPYTDPIALNAERLLLRTVVGALKDHPAIGMWNLGNEPDLFARPPNAEAGRAWVRKMVSVIRESGSPRPITCGLHTDSLLQENGLRVDHVFAETEAAVMHAYPMYSSVARHPLDPDYVPFTCALTSALCGKPTLMQEFGGCTAPPGQPSFVWEWTGALVWCFADYVPELWDRPPCSESRHERFFGLVRSDGSLKPQAKVLQKFAATKPTVKPAAKKVSLPISADDYYRDPEGHLRQLYQQFVAQ